MTLDVENADGRVIGLIAALEKALQEARDARRRLSYVPPHPDSERRYATVYERAAWHHDIGQHAGSEEPYQFCPRCEMEHPFGRFHVLLRATAAVLGSTGTGFLVPPTLAALEQLREAVNGK